MPRFREQYVIDLIIGSRAGFEMSISMAGAIYFIESFFVLSGGKRDNGIDFTGFLLIHDQGLQPAFKFACLYPMHRRILGKQIRQNLTKLTL